MLRGGAIGVVPAFSRVISTDNTICYKSFARLLLLLVAIKRVVALVSRTWLEAILERVVDPQPFPDIWLFKLRI